MSGSKIEQIIQKDLVSEDDMDYLNTCYINEMMQVGRVIKMDFFGTVNRKNYKNVLKAAMFRLAFKYYTEKYENILE